MLIFARRGCVNARSQLFIANQSENLIYVGVVTL